MAMNATTVENKSSASSPPTSSQMMMSVLEGGTRSEPVFLFAFRLDEASVLGLTGGGSLGFDLTGGGAFVFGLCFLVLDEEVDDLGMMMNEKDD